MKHKIIILLILLFFIFCFLLKTQEKFSNDEKSIIIIGNAPYKKKMGTEIDKYKRVVRFNSFSLEGHEDYIGSKVTDWIVSDSFILLEKSKFLKTYKKYPNINLNIILPRVFKDNVEKLKRKLPEHIFNKANILIQDEDIKVSDTYNFRGRWPSTGVLAINYYVKKYNVITISGFNHFDPKEKTIHYYEQRKQIGHKHNLEKKIVDDLVLEGKVIRL